MWVPKGLKESFKYAKKLVFLMIFRSKKGQLGVIEFKYFMMGLVIGLIAAFILVALMNAGVIGVKLPLLTCAAAA